MRLYGVTLDACSLTSYAQYMTDSAPEPGTLEQRLGDLGAELIAELESQLASEEYEQTVLVADDEGKILTRSAVYYDIGGLPLSNTFYALHIEGDFEEEFEDSSLFGLLRWEGQASPSVLVWDFTWLASLLTTTVVSAENEVEVTLQGRALNPDFSQVMYSAESMHYYALVALVSEIAAATDLSDVEPMLMLDMGQAWGTLPIEVPSEASLQQLINGAYRLFISLEREIALVRFIHDRRAYLFCIFRSGPLGGTASMLYSYALAGPGQLSEPEFLDTSELIAPEVEVEPMRLVRDPDASDDEPEPVTQREDGVLERAVAQSSVLVFLSVAGKEVSINGTFHHDQDGLPRTVDGVRTALVFAMEQMRTFDTATMMNVNPDSFAPDTGEPMVKNIIRQVEVEPLIDALAALAVSEIETALRHAETEDVLVIPAIPPGQDRTLCNVIVGPIELALTAGELLLE